MKTKFHIISGGVTYDVAPTDIRNWDEIEFTLERKDYSGVMRSFSSEFKFVGEAYKLLRNLYLANGLLADAVVAVSTKNNDWTYTEQFRCPLDFSTIEMQDGVLTINAVDNSLAALLKSKKGQKYEFPVEEFDLTNIQLGRMAFGNSQKFTLPRSSNPSGNVDVRKDDANSAVISTAYIEPYDESTGYDSTPANSFFAKINIAPSPLIRIAFDGYVNYRLDVVRDNAVAELQLGYWVDDASPHFQLWNTFCDNDISKELRYGSIRNKWIGKNSHANYATLDALKAAAAARTDIIGLYPGYFGIVGNNAYPNASYWTDNVVYEYTGYTWIAKGAPNTYNKYVHVSAYASMNNLATYEYPRLQLTNSMLMNGATLTMTWTDPAEAVITEGCINPAELLQRIVDNISPGSTSSIAEDDAGLLAKTFIAPAEVLRRIPDPNVFTTFQQFCDWMQAVFGYTYRIDGNEVQFVHRSEVFSGSSVKVIEHVRDVKYSVVDSLIYSEVDAGYSKKEYGEINGRLETNFTNYYATGFNATDKKLSLISKYRADSYGIEFTIRKGEKENETKDDKNDEDVFFVCAEMDDGAMKYNASKNDAYAPSVCIANNVAYIAAMGNGAAVTLTMTSSDGNNELDDITIPADTNLFTVGKLEFTTDDMLLPAVWDGLIQIDHNGYRYQGYITKAESSFARQGGMDYELIIKDITEL